jgi:hypothetical protein
MAAAVEWRADASAFRDNGKIRERRRWRAPLTLRRRCRRRFLDLEVDHYTIERIVEATTLQARMLKLPPRCVMLLV